MDVDEAKRQLKLRYDKELATWLGLKDPKTIGNYRRAGALPVGQAARVELAALKAAEAAAQSQAAQG